MARKKNSTSKSKENTNEDPCALHHWLFLTDYFIKLLGADRFEDLREALSDIEPGYGDDGLSTYCRALETWADLRTQKNKGGLCITADELERHDFTIARHMAHINQRHNPPIQLKYFQWLAALVTEIYLERFFNDQIAFLNALEAHMETYIDKSLTTLDPESVKDRFSFEPQHLRRLAFWMATGSGKTLLLHLQYLQVLDHNKRSSPDLQISFDNILLITPNEDLTDQHLRELEASSIPCSRFDPARYGGLCTWDNQCEIQVIEITKLVEEKKGSGVTVNIEDFGTKNLVFVDEAHKGTSGKKWRYFRNELAKDGFTVEYSATFGQAVATGGFVENDKNEDLLATYSRSVLFNYSYHYFYNDGYGKDYRLLNLRKDAYENKDILFLANLLTFYQQKAVYYDPEHADLIQEYSIEDPLLIFVGTRVTTGENSDILSIIRFLHRVLTDRSWAINIIQSFLEGKSGIITQNNHDLFGPTFQEKRLRYIRDKFKELGLTSYQIYDDLRKLVFNTNALETGLAITPLQGVEGELALAAGDGTFFGLIYIGETSKFTKLIEKNLPMVEVRPSLENHPSLFATIDTHNPPVNILIGAKKFREGWDCYRISAMGLLNIGKKEGSAIIQLFGRGIRLRGKDSCLKRSTSLIGEDHPYIPILETLTIFGVEAHYLEQFESSLREERGSTAMQMEFNIPIHIETQFIEDRLYLPICDPAGFTQNERFLLTLEDIPHVAVETAIKVDILESHALKNQALEADSEIQPVTIDSGALELVDWDRIFMELLTYRHINGWHNMIFLKEMLYQFIKSGNYSLKCPESLAKPKRCADIPLLEDIITNILKKALRTVYSQRKNQWLQRNTRLQLLDITNGNFREKEYIVEVKEDQPEIISRIQNITSQLEKFCSSSGGRFITNVAFDNHLFAPLLAKEHENDSRLKIFPEPLNKGEQKFLELLRTYIQENSSVLSNKKIYLLRNFPRRGVGFFKTAWFYPDFIIWIVDNVKKNQHIIFADPKGIIHTRGFEDDKVQLAHDIKNLEKRVSDQLSQMTVKLDSYIISRSPRDQADAVFRPKRKEDYNTHHVLFISDDKCITKLLSIE